MLIQHVKQGLNVSSLHAGAIGSFCRKVESRNMDENRYCTGPMLYSVHDIQLTETLRMNIPAYHALSGCDTVSQLMGYGQNVNLEGIPDAQGVLAVRIKYISRENYSRDCIAITRDDTDFVQGPNFK